MMCSCYHGALDILISNVIKEESQQISASVNRCGLVLPLAQCIEMCELLVPCCHAMILCNLRWRSLYENLVRAGEGLLYFSAMCWEV